MHKDKEVPMATAGRRKLRLGERGKGLLKATKRFVEDDMMTYAAAMAYHTFFSLFAFLIFFIALLGILQIPSFFDRLVEEAQTVLPEQAMRIVEQVIPNPAVYCQA